MKSMDFSEKSNGILSQEERFSLAANINRSSMKFSHIEDKDSDRSGLRTPNNKQMTFEYVEQTLQKRNEEMYSSVFE